jgi:hypothetical protein
MRLVNTENGLDIRAMLETPIGSPETATVNKAERREKEEQTKNQK